MHRTRIAPSTAARVATLVTTLLATLAATLALHSAAEAAELEIADAGGVTLASKATSRPTAMACGSRAR